MQTFVFVHFLGEKGKPNLNLFQSSVFPVLTFFNFECFKKAFRGGIVARIAFTGHADHKAKAPSDS
jgi:hypothetical protein